MTAAPSPPLERLLEHREWVRHVARSLVRDDSAADDLAQEVWLEAVARPPREATSPRGWLARVLRHNAVDAGRSARRRAARESAAVRREVVRDAADVVAEAELHRRVVDAVLALGEPARGTLLLRFFDGLPPAAIAARQGVPVETVRTRIKRALADLRERFDREHGGDRRAWAVLLAPLAEGPAAAPEPEPRAVPTALVPAALGVLAGTACIVAVVLALGTDPGGDAPTTAADVSAVDASGGAEPARGALADRASRAAPDAASATSDASGGSSAGDLPPDTWLAIHVIDEDRNPVRGARLAISVPADAPEGLRKWATAHEVGVRNPFPLHSLPPDADGWEVRLGATAAGLTPADAVAVTLESGRTQVTRLVLSRPRSLRVRVTDATTGAPLPGVRVVSRTELARRGIDEDRIDGASGDGWGTTGDDGVARIGGLGRGKHVVTADPPRYLRAHAIVTAGGAEAAELALPPLPYPGRVRAVVRVPGGGGAAGIPVTLTVVGPQGASSFLQRVTDAAGVCVFEDLPAGRHFVATDAAAVLRAAAAAVSREDAERISVRGAFTGVVLAEGGEAVAELGDVHGSGKVVVRIVDAGGNPVAGTRVVLQPGPSRDTDADGTAEFAGLREGDAFSVEVDGWTGPVATASAEPKTVTWTVGGGRAELVLRGADGRFLPAFTTVQVVAGGRLRYLSVGRDGRRPIGAEGALSISGLPAGPVTLQAWTAGDRSSFAVLDVPPGGIGTAPDGRVEVTLRPCGAVRVRTSQSNVNLVARGADGAESSLWIDGEASVRSWISGPLAAGTWVVEGTVGGVPFRREVAVREGETVVLE